MQTAVPVELTQLPIIVASVWISSIIFTTVVAEIKHRSGLGWFVMAIFLGPLALLAVGMSPTRTEFEKIDDMCEICGRSKEGHHSETSFRDQSGRRVTRTHCTGPATAYQMQKVIEALERQRPAADE